MRKPPILRGKAWKAGPPPTAEALELDTGDEYLWKATRVDLETLSLVVVECAHPNVGYYEEVCLFLSSMHSPDWECIPLSEIWPEWEEEKGFLESFPAFRKLFKRRNYTAEILQRMFGDSFHSIKKLKGGKLHYPRKECRRN